MNPLSLISKRVLILLPLLCALAGADTIYDVSGSFQPSSPSNPFTGPLNGGTFSGTFSATLPPSGSSGGDSIFSFNIDLFDSSGAVLAHLSSASGGSGAVYVQSGFCGISASTTGPCDQFVWGSPGATDSLQLVTPLGFTGGTTYSGFLIGLFSSLALVGGTSSANGSLVAFGSIEPAPEPGTLVLLGLGAVVIAGLWIKRGRLFA